MGTTARHVGRPQAPRRPSSPSRGRNSRYPAPSPQRLRPYRSKTHGGMPLLARLFLAFALLALAGGTVLAATGLGTTALKGLGATVAGAIAALGGPSPSPTPALAPGAPRLVLTGSGWTNEKEWTVHGFVPLGLGDQKGHSVRIYVNGELAAEQALAGTQDFAVTVTIADGPSTITASVVGPGGESAESAPIEVVLDDRPPAIKIKAPEDGEKVDGDTVRVRGTTQRDATVSIRNLSNGGRASDVATDGNFSIEISLTSGPNVLEIAAVDPAGNTRTTTLKVVGAGGSATARLSLTSTSFKLSRLPSALGASVRVLGPDDQAIDGAHVSFIIQVPGIAPITSPERLTSGGTASFNTVIPREGVRKQTGLVTVVVVTDQYGQLDDAVAFVIY